MNQALLNISSNLRRIAQWAYEYPNEVRMKNITTFLDETDTFTSEIKNQPEQSISSAQQQRVEKFLKEFPVLKSQWPEVADNHIRRLVWAERMNTWSSLLD